MILNIVTPCSRFKNLKLIVDSIKTITNMDVLWHICFDNKTIPSIDAIDINHKFYNLKN